MNYLFAEHSVEIQAILEKVGADKSYYKNKKCAIYGLYDGNVLLYVGESKNVYARWAQHVKQGHDIIQKQFAYEDSPPLYFHVADAMQAGTFNVRILVHDIEDKTQRMKIEYEHCVRLGQHGIYNKSNHKIKSWPIILTHPKIAEAQEEKALCLKHKAEKEEHFKKRSIELKCIYEALLEEHDPELFHASPDERYEIEKARNEVQRQRFLVEEKERGLKSREKVLAKITAGTFTPQQISRAVKQHTNRYNEFAPLGDLYEQPL